MANFISLTATHRNTSSSRYFNGNRIKNPVANGSGCDFSVDEFNGKLATWNTATGFATVKAAIANYITGKKVQVTYIERRGTSYTETEAIDIDKIVYFYASGSYSVILYDSGERNQLDKLIVNVTPANLNTAIDLASETGENYQGVINCSANPNFPAASKDQYYKISVAGKIGGASGDDVEAGDVITCIANTAAGDKATVGTNWIITQVNMIPCTVSVLRTGTNNSDYVTAKTIKDAGITTAAATIMALAGGTTNQLALTSTGAAGCLNISATNLTTGKAIDITSSSVSDTAILVNSINLTHTMGVASAVNMVEAVRFTLASEVQMGNWANAVCGRIDLGAAGYVTGLAGVVCAELQLPSGGVTGGAGTYTCFEAEIGMDGVSNSAPVSAMAINVWGARVADFDTNGFIFDISGVTVNSGKVFQVNTAGAASHALRIRINGTPYYIMLTETGA